MDGIEVDVTEVIATQAITIHTISGALKDKIKALQAIKTQLVCIGGPLNDNKLGYTKEQQEIFGKIYRICNNEVE